MNDALTIDVGVAALLASLAAWLLFRWRQRLPLAVRNARTLHTAPVPRVAGVALWLGFMPAALLAPPMSSLPLSAWVPPWLALFSVSLVDDIRGVAIAPRLLVHVFAASWFAMAMVGMDANMGAVTTPVALIVLIALVVAWALNLYNFMDGSDGLAALMTVIGFAAYGAVLLQQGLPATMPLALAAAALPVFAINRPPARMFLGDVGAVPLGFLAAAIGVGGVVDGSWAVWFPVLVFLPFIADASVTLVRRALAGERFWEGHKSHYYQRLHRMGAGHAGTLAVFGALMAGSASTAVACAALRPGWGPPALAVWCTICALLFAAIDYHWRRYAQRT